MSETPMQMTPNIWGTISNKDAVAPSKRPLLPDIASPKFQHLVDLALVRVVDAAFPFEFKPPRLFPTSETFFAEYFSQDDWLLHRNLETELGRMSYMLSNLPERSIPSICVPLIQGLLSQKSILKGWKLLLPQLKEKINQEVDWVLKQMLEQQQQVAAPPSRKADFISIPVDYRTGGASMSCAKQLWHRCLEEMSHQILRGHFSEAREFLEIFSFLKDPIGGVTGSLDKATELFTALMVSLKRAVRHSQNISSSHLRWHAAVVQAAQEAIFLATPLLDDIRYIHFVGHQQLPYVYVQLDELPRSEFSIPGHVLQIMEEILNECERGNGQCSVAPISVSTYPSLPLSEENTMTVIIDGNHRVTATMMLRLIAEHPAALETNSTESLLGVFCQDHRLGIKWKVDLGEVLNALRSSKYSEIVRNRMDLVERFQYVDAIPALVVREDDFHTACQQRPALATRPRLLLPFHQALYNGEELCFAFPQAGQVHGRAVGYKAMPLF